MYISKIEIENIRCFKEKIQLSFDLNGDKPPWTVIVGDNATGKSCLLRCIAIGLCDESSASGLLKEFEEGYIHREADKGSIVIYLRDTNQPDEEYTIFTTIEKIPILNKNSEADSVERVRQETIPSRDFPWGKIFACAYGAGRGTSGTGDVAGYSVINAVYNMFNYNEGLQNPELAIRRIKEHFAEEKTFDIIKNLLPHTDRYELTDTGITVDGPWGKNMPLRDLADGYRSTFLWVTDLIGWALSYDPDIDDSKDIKGIVLIDEIEQHLHPKWQREILRLLNTQFPNIQFIFTSHSPMIAANIDKLFDDDLNSQLLHLANEGNNLKLTKIEEKIGELDFAQVLSSEAFDYIFDISIINPKISAVLREASILAGKDKRTADEELKLNKFKKALRAVMFPKGKTPIERLVEKEYYDELLRKIDEFRRILEQ